MSSRKQYEEGWKYFDDWYALSLVDLKGSKFYFNESEGKMNADIRNAAISAHQATEHIYHRVLLSLTLYSPKLHNLHDLRKLAAPELADIWPRNRKFYKRSFARLLRAYVEARYSLHYKINAEELQWIYRRIEMLQNKVKQICEAHLQEQIGSSP